MSVAQLLVFDKSNTQHYGEGVQNLHLKLLQGYSTHCVTDICNPAHLETKQSLLNQGLPLNLH